MILDNAHIRYLNEDDLPAILELQEETILGLKDKTILRKNSPEILLQSISEQNIALGVFINDELIAIGLTVLPVPPETDLREKLIIVKEKYRGNGLQRKLIRLMEEEALSRGVTHLCTSVSPNNPYSYNNVLAMGYEFDHQEEIYGGLLRNIYVKELKANE